MKKYGMLAIAAIFMFSVAIMAQNQAPQNGGNGGYGQGGRQMATAQVRAERLAKQLTLTDDQKTQVQALFEKQDANRAKAQAGVTKSREEMRAQFDADRKVQDEDLSKIIGAEKFQQYQAARAERMKNMQNRGNGQNGGSTQSN